MSETAIARASGRMRERQRGRASGRVSETLARSFFSFRLRACHAKLLAELGEIDALAPLASRRRRGAASQNKKCSPRRRRVRCSTSFGKAGARRRATETPRGIRWRWSRGTTSPEDQPGGEQDDGAGVARAIGIFLAWGGAGMARAWRGHILFPLFPLFPLGSQATAGISCSPWGHRPPRAYPVPPGVTGHRGHITSSGDPCPKVVPTSP
eukprot:gene8973-biopygen9221